MEAPDTTDCYKAHAQSPEECMCKCKGPTQPTGKGGGLRGLLEVEMLSVRSSVNGERAGIMGSREMAERDDVADKGHQKNKVKSKKQCCRWITTGGFPLWGQCAMDSGQTTWV